MKTNNIYKFTKENLMKAIDGIKEILSDFI